MGGYSDVLMYVNNGIMNWTNEGRIGILGCFPSVRCFSLLSIFIFDGIIEADMDIKVQCVFVITVWIVMGTSLKIKEP